MQQEVIEIFEKLKFKPSYSVVGNNLIGFKKSFGDVRLSVSFIGVYDFHLTFVTHDGIHYFNKNIDSFGDDPELTIHSIFSRLFQKLNDYCLCMDDVL
jgi:hypothetical protein